MFRPWWEEQYPEPEIPCDICDHGVAAAGVNGFHVCSAECEEEALSRRPPETQEEDDEN